jgi:hypothetical protein
MRKTAIGLQNFRDVGGRPTRSGATVCEGVLYRSDAPRAGDPPPRKVAWPPATVIDLRAPGEAGGRHPLAGPRCEEYSIPLMPEAGLARIVTGPVEADESLSDLYRRTLPTIGSSLATVIELIVASPGATLVHCTAGKDRTGIVVAVVLTAVGVSREQVVADYTVTEGNMEGVLARMATAPGVADAAVVADRARRMRPELFTAPASAITALLDALDELGGVESWLLSCGLAESSMRRLYERLLVDGLRAASASEIDTAAEVGT